MQPTFKSCDTMTDSAAFATAILGRGPIITMSGSVKAVIRDRRILITGAGGFIGSNLARLAAKLGAGHVGLLDNGEYALYSIDSQIAELYPRLSRRAFLCDVRDAVATHRCIAADRPDFIVHAAALKQLPVVESHIREGFLTNTLGTLNVASAALSVGTRVAILISTDKAAHPSSGLGATKRLAEQLFQSFDLDGGGGRFVSVRFSNVFGAPGSVVPRFRRQIAAGGPITITHPSMRCSFITLDEACDVVFAAMWLTAKEVKSDDLYVVDPGLQLSVLELARRLAAHDAPRLDIPIVVVGPRDGESLGETPLAAGEHRGSIGMRAVGPMSSPVQRAPIEPRAIQELVQTARDYDERRLRKGLALLVPEFRRRMTPRSTESSTLHDLRGDCT
jgi:FlaA1/EpsC-like NDP-sugar epimerase